MRGQDPDELFDVVDEHDRVVGVMARREVHRLGLRHRAIHVLIFNRAGEIFLQKRSRYKDAHPGLKSTSCAGHLDTGEDYEAAAKRELAEELGLAPEDVPALTPLFKLPPRRATGMEFVRVFSARHDGPFTLNPAEVESGEWGTAAALDAALVREQREYTPSLALIWAQYQA
jgi:isopentenyl-diphosphate delta-isomerase type 1